MQEMAHFATLSVRRPTREPTWDRTWRATHDGGRMAAPAGLSSGPVPEPIDAQKADPDLVTPGPEAADPSAAQSAAAEPGTAELGAAELGAGEPGAAGTVVTELKAADARAAEPVATEPEAAEPTATQQAAADPAEQAAADPVGQAPGGSALAVVEPDAEPAEPEPAGHADEARAVRPLAVAAAVVGIIALVGVALAVLAVVTHGFRPKTIVTYRTAAVFKLRPGDCINSSPNGLSVSVRSCATPHDAEVFATFSLTRSSWPGSAVVQQEAGNGCMSRVAGYVNPAFVNAGFAEEYVYPDQDAWQAGVRTVVCEIRASSGQLTGSVRQGS